MDLSYGRYRLLPLRYEDIFIIKDWRNRQIDVLRQKNPLTDEEQQIFYEEKVLPSQQSESPRMILFSYLYNYDCVGYGGLVNINWLDERAEVSFLMNPDFVFDDETYEESFSSFLTMVKFYAFERIGLNRLFTETFEIRTLHIDILEKNGFKLEGRLREQVKIGKSYVDSLMHGCLKGKHRDVMD